MPDLTAEEIKRIITPPEQEPITGVALPEQMPIEQPPADINPEMQDLGAEATMADAQTMEQPIYG